MTPLARTLLLTALAIGLTGWALPLLYPLVGDPDGYLRILDRKTAHLKADTNRGRLLLVGGSNVALGLDASALQWPGGCYNLAVTGDLGLPFMLAQAEDLARPEDVIVVSPEYEVRQGGLRTLALVSLESPGCTPYIHLSILDWLRFHTRRAQLTALACLAHLGLDARTHSAIYNVHVFDATGNVTAHLGKVAEDIRLRPSPDTAFADFRPVLIECLRPLAPRHPGRLFYLPPPVPQSAYRRDSARYQYLFNRFCASIGLTPLAVPRSMVFPDTLFYDSQDHLGSLGRAQRTRFLQAVLNRRFSIKDTSRT